MCSSNSRKKAQKYVLGRKKTVSSLISCFCIHHLHNSSSQVDSMLATFRAPKKVRIFISIMPISSSNPLFDNLLESSHQDDSYKWSNTEFGEEMVHFF